MDNDILGLIEEAERLKRLLSKAESEDDKQKIKRELNEVMEKLLKLIKKPKAGL